MRTRASDTLELLAILAVDAHIPPWDARDNLTLEEANAILDLLHKRAQSLKD